MDDFLRRCSFPRMGLPLLGLALATALASPATAQARRVADLDARALPGLSSDPHRPITRDRDPGRRNVRSFARIRGLAIFVATTCEAGEEVFASDGTAAGTVLLADIQPGAAGSSPEKFAACTVGGQEFCVFTATRDDTGAEPWITDGTPGGTMPLGDLDPGTRSSIARDFVSFNGRIWFAAGHPQGGEALWSSDGTAAGTRPETPFASGLLLPVNLFVNEVRNELYFQTSTPTTGRELHKVDAAGNVGIVADLRPGLANGILLDGQGYVQLGADVYFCASDGVNGVELWRTDGTAAGTRMIVDFVPGANGLATRFEEAVVFGNRIVFAGSTNATGTELFETDGTAAGTRLIADLRAGTSSSEPQGLTVVGGSVLFALGAGSELLRYDGNVVTTAVDVQPGSSNSSPRDLAPFGNGILFTANVTGFGREPFVSDGTPANTFRLADLVAGGSSSQGVDDLAFFTDLGNGTALFAATAPIGGSSQRELWRTDGTTAGTLLAADIDPTVPTRSSAPSDLAASFGATLLLNAGGATGREPYAFDVPGGLRSLGDLVPGSGDSDPAEFTDCGVWTWFAAGSSGRGRELWRTDGTLAGTLLFDLDGAASSSEPEELTCCEGLLFFTATSPAAGRELWQLDPQTGIATVLDIEAGPNGSSPSGLTCCDGKLFFAATTAAHGRELWCSDGTAAGTVLVADLVVGAAGSSPSQLACLRDPLGVGGRLAFAATVPGVGRELFLSDGTAAGTALLADLRPGAGSSAPLGLTAAGGLVFFRADDGVSGADPWVTDGTVAGTRRLADVVTVTTTSSSGAGLFTAVGDRVFFVANEDCSASSCRGIELWVTDGTPAGTRIVVDLAPRSLDSDPDDLVAVGDELWFTATTPATGRELWRTDGTAAGTRLAADVVPGSLSGDPFDLVLCAGSLYFAALGCDGDEELYVVDCPAAAVEVLGAPCGDLHVSGSPARLGGSLDVTVTRTDATHPVLFGLGIHRPRGIELPGLLDTRCVLHLDLPLVEVLGPDPGLRVSRSVPVPNDPALLCIGVAGQAVIWPGGGQPATLSAGLLWTIGG